MSLFPTTLNIHVSTCSADFPWLGKLKLHEVQPQTQGALNVLIPLYHQPCTLYMYMYMLRTDLQPLAGFKAAWLALKLAARFIA